MLRHAKTHGVPRIPRRQIGKKRFPLPQCAAQKGVDKARRVRLSHAASEPHRLIDSGIRRNFIHVQKLIQRHPQNFQNRRVDASNRTRRQLFNNEVKCQLSLDHAIDKARQKRLVPRIKRRFLQQCIEDDVGIAPVAVHTGKRRDRRPAGIGRHQSFLLLRPATMRMRRKRFISETNSAAT